MTPFRIPLYARTRLRALLLVAATLALVLVAPGCPGDAGTPGESEPIGADGNDAVLNDGGTAGGSAVDSSRRQPIDGPEPGDLPVNLIRIDSVTLAKAGARIVEPSATANLAFLALVEPGPLHPFPYPLARERATALPVEQRFGPATRWMLDAIAAGQTIALVADAGLESSRLTDVLDALRPYHAKTNGDCLTLALPHGTSTAKAWALVPVLPLGWAAPEVDKSDGTVVLVRQWRGALALAAYNAAGRFQWTVGLGLDEDEASWVTALTDANVAAALDAHQPVWVFGEDEMPAAYTIRAYIALRAAAGRAREQLCLMPGFNWPGPPDSLEDRVYELMGEAVVENPPGNANNAAGNNGASNNNGAASNNGAAGNNAETGPRSDEPTVSIRQRDVAPMRAPLPTLREYAFSGDFDLGLASLLAAKRIDPDLNIVAAARELNDIATAVAQELGETATITDLFTAIARELFLVRRLRAEADARIAAREAACNVLPTVLAKGRGNCQSLTTIVLAVLDRLGAGGQVYGVELPGHVYLRYDDGKLRVPFESTSNGAALTAEQYATKFHLAHPIPDELPFDKNRSRKETLAFLLNNLSVVLSDRGDHDGAIELCDLALNLLPSHVPALVNRGLERLALNQPARALTDLEAAYELFREQPKVAIAMAQARRRLDDAAGALEVLEEAAAWMEREPGVRYEYLIQLGLTYDKLERREEAARVLTSAMADRECPPDARPEILTHIGRVRLADGKAREACEAFAEARTLFNALARSGRDVTDGLSVCLRSYVTAARRLNDLVLADELLVEAVVVEPQAAELWTLRGEVALARGNRSMAQQAFEQAVTVGNDPWARLRLGEMALADDDNDVALRQCEAVIDRVNEAGDDIPDPDALLGNAYFLGVRALLGLDRVSVAQRWIDDAERALDADRWAATLHQLRAEAHHTAGDYRKALQALDAYKAAGGDDEAVLRWRDELRRQLGD